MFRHRARSDLPPLDQATAERMLDGAPVDDISDSHRQVMEILGILARPATPDELDGAAAAAAEFLTAHDAANRPVRRTRPMVALAVTTTLFALSTGTAVAATEGVLPEPVQAVAHEALGVVGISVPDITPEHPDPAIDGVTSGNVDSVTTGSGTDPAGVVTGATTNSGGISPAGDKVTSTPGGRDAANGKGDPATLDPTPPEGPSGPKDDKPGSGPGSEPKPAPDPKDPKPGPEPRAPKDEKEPKDDKKP